jgi:serine/threonine-protein kinase
MLEKKVAVKLLSEDMSRKQDLVQRFMQEAKAASRVGQENIIDVTDVGQTAEGSVFFVMEYLDGRDLAGLLRKEGALPWPRIQAIGAQICRALGAAHAKGIIHRDLKPENVFLVDREGRHDFVKVLDFGIAKMSGSDGGEAARLTRTGMIFGTPEYMSPEQARGEKVDHRVDVYAMGVILYEMICGEVPFKADSFMGVLTKHMMEPPQPPSARRPDLGVPAGVEQFVMRALSKEREQRFQDMDELGRALAEARWDGGVGAAAGAGTAPKPSTAESTHGEARPQKRAGSGKWIAVAAGAVVVAAGGILWFGGRESSPPAASSVAVAPAPAASALPAPPPPSSASVAIRFETTPSDAEVVWGGQVRGRTPMELRVPVASVPTTVILRKAGHADRPVEFVPSEARAFMLPLEGTPVSGAPAKPPAPAASRPIRRPAATSTRPPPAASPAPGAAPAPAPPKPKPVEGLKDPFGQ